MPSARSRARDRRHRRDQREEKGAFVTAPTPGIAGISAIAYALPAQQRSVRELDALGQLESDPALLEQFGFSHVYVADEETPYSLALAAARALLDEYSVA